MTKLVPIHRPLGDVEYVYWSLDRAVGANFVVVLECAGEVSSDQLRQGLDGLQAASSSLRVALVVSDGVLQFAPSEQAIALEELSGEEDWLSQVEAAKGRHFGLGEGPLVRCVAQRSEALVQVALIFHHAIADATCASWLAHGLFLQLKAQVEGEAPQLPLLEDARPVESVFAPSHRGLRGMWRLYKLANRKLWRGLTLGLPKMEVTDQMVPMSERREHFLPHRFSADDTAALVARCRAEGCSVHGALCAAQLMALQGEFDARRTTLGLLSLVSLRERVAASIDAQAMGPNIGFTTTTHRVERGGSLWELARHIHGEIRLFVEGGEAHLVVTQMGRTLRRLKFHGKVPEKASGWFDRMEGVLPPASVVSNVGRLPFAPEAGALQLEGIHFFVPIAGSARFGSSAVTSCGRLRWNFTYSEPAISPERAERVAARALSTLQGALAG